MKTTSLVFATAMILFGGSTTAFGSTGINSATVENNAVLTINYTKTDISCFGHATGAVELSISGGIAPYNVVWNTGAVGMQLSGLSGGKYTAKVTDASGLSSEEVVTIEQPKPLSILFHTNTGMAVEEFNGSMNVAVTGGTPWDYNGVNDYFVRIDNKAGFEKPEQIQSGTHKLSIEDSKGCKLTIPVALSVKIVTLKKEADFNISVFENVASGLPAINMFIIHNPLIRKSIMQSDLSLSRAE
jgi:hypothetical protein